MYVLNVKRESQTPEIRITCTLVNIMNMKYLVFDYIFELISKTVQLNMDDKRYRFSLVTINIEYTTLFSQEEQDEMKDIIRKIKPLLRFENEIELCTEKQTLVTKKLIWLFQHAINEVRLVRIQMLKTCMCCADFIETLCCCKTVDNPCTIFSE